MVTGATQLINRLVTDEDVIAACESLRSAGQAVTVRRVYPFVGGNWPRLSRLVAAFNRGHDALALMTAAYEEAILANQELMIENGSLKIRLNELVHLVEQLKAKLIESDRNATLMFQGSMDER